MIENNAFNRSFLDNIVKQINHNYRQRAWTDIIFQVVSLNQ